MTKEEEKQYNEAFNLGYRIAENHPEIEELITKANGDSPIFDGLRDGQQQYIYDLDRDKELDSERSKEQEKLDKKTNRLTWLNDDRLKGRDIAPSKDKDIEPEI
ncbi:hypothetical protein [Pedobacter sp. MC2016-24]|uniref:hypothetical protein n=1 Tax=Pedobacter sp. MC2016-24 TaxID=2780090 RepID=UPI00187EF641|nr:hypothetical protein [Pedobacter sp. MC2016-24]MBE9602643.1 hypothetical protein [Pedobacter sp. MC2016-24]